MIITPRAHARSGVKQSVLSVCLSVVCLSVVCQAEKKEIYSHKPSKWSQTMANSKKLLYVYLTEVKALSFAVFSSYFLLFVIFGPTSPASQYSIYGKRSLPHLGYGIDNTLYYLWIWPYTNTVYAIAALFDAHRQRCHVDCSCTACILA